MGRTPEINNMLHHMLNYAITSIKRSHTYLLFALILSLTGCSSRAENVTTELLPTINLADLLPREWDYQEYADINIDEDGTHSEFLVFFEYDDNGPSNKVNPVGVVIYDKQKDGTLLTGEDEPMPRQPSGMLTPYRLLPSYWEGGGQGFVALSNEDIRVEPIQPSEATPVPDVPLVEGGPTPTPTAVPAADELIIWGGDTRMTVVWWKNIHEGYGLAQVYAPGGLDQIQRTPSDITNQTPVESLRGFWPRNDRSSLCYEMYYERQVNSAPGRRSPWQKPIDYAIIPRGITFCHRTPEYPYYPEGVVLAYLLNPTNSPHLLDGGVDGQRAEAFQQLLGGANTYYVDNLQAYPTLPLMSRQELEESSPLQTNVCAELRRSASGERLIYYFQLNHYDADFIERLPDRLKIVNISDQTQSVADCRGLIQP